MCLKERDAIAMSFPMLVSCKVQVVYMTANKLKLAKLLPAPKWTIFIIINTHTEAAGFVRCIYFAKI